MKSGIILENFDHTVRPQDDFYHYVNGSWLQQEKIPLDKTAIGTFCELHDKSLDNVKKIVEGLSVAASNDEKYSAEQKVSDLYESYMNTEVIDNLGLQPLQKELTIIENSLDTKKQMATYFAKMNIMGGMSPINFFVDTDEKNSEYYVCKIWQGSLGLPDRDYYFDTEEKQKNIRKSYVKHLSLIFNLLGYANSEESASLVFNLETRLAEHHWTNIENRDIKKKYNKINVESLSDIAPNFDWSAYLAMLGVQDQTTIIVNQPSYIEGFDKVFKESSLEVWKLFLKWSLVREFARFLDKRFSELHFDFYMTVLHGQKKQQERWRRAIGLINGALGEVVGQVYVKHHFVPEAKERMTQLFSNIQKAFEVSLHNLDWMSLQTKRSAICKLNQFVSKIGYPDRWKSYDALVIDSKDLVGNIMRINADQHNKEIQRLGSPVQKWEWFMNPQTVNAYYNPAMNEIVLPAAILQIPFFDLEADDAVNYGAIGSVIAHEMGHGFDDQGSKYDGYGNLKNWWESQDLKAFKKRTEKLVKQYDQFNIFDDLNVNGKLTLGENIGDLSGLTIAYKAYQLSLGNINPPVIDGLTGSQRFFIGYAQVWRIKIKEEHQRMLAKIDPHSPGIFRVLGPLSNIDEFYSAFDVQESDAMYIPPEHRVKIW